MKRLRDAPQNIASDASKVFQIIRTFMVHFKEGCALLKSLYDAEKESAKIVSKPVVVEEKKGESWVQKRRGM